MPHFPSFSDTTLFPPFKSCPLAEFITTNPSNVNSQPHLLAQITQNMTLSQTPTFICRDTTLQTFALKIHPSIPNPNPALTTTTVAPPTLSTLVLKKHHNQILIIPNPKREGVRDGKQGFVSVQEGAVRVLPCGLGELKKVEGRWGGEEGEGWCVVCGEEVANVCKGCRWVWYCGKECQIKGWNEGGHKEECKILRAIGLAFPESVGGTKEE